MPPMSDFSNYADKQFAALQQGQMLRQELYAAQQKSCLPTIAFGADCPAPPNRPGGALTGTLAECVDAAIALNQRLQAIIHRLVGSPPQGEAGVKLERDSILADGGNLKDFLSAAHNKIAHIENSL